MSPSNKSGRNISHITSNHEYFENICSSLWLESLFSILYLLSSDLYIFISWIDWKCFVRWCLCGQKLKKHSSYFTARLMLNQKSILSHWSCLAAIREAIRNLEVLQQLYYVLWQQHVSGVPSLRSLYLPTNNATKCFEGLQNAAKCLITDVFWYLRAVGKIKEEKYQ